MEALINFLSEYVKLHPWSVIIYNIIGLIAFIVVAWKFVISPGYHHVYLPISIFFTGITKTIMIVDFLEKELKPNGGNTLRDKINLINQELSRIHRDLTAFKNKQDIMLDFIGFSEDGMGFFEANINGNCTYVSHKYCEISGLLETEAYGSGWINAIKSEDRDDVLKEWELCVKQGRTFIMGYSFINKKEDKEISITCYATPIRCEEGIIGYIGAIKRNTQS